MRILFFEDDIMGHRMEYLHHYYIGAVSHPENTYVFYVPKDFENDKGKFDWPYTQNVIFCYFTEKELSTINSGNLIISGLKKSLLLRAKVKEVKADNVFLSTFTIFIPFICFLLPSTVKVSGILYDVHLLNSPTTTLRGVLENLRYRIALKSDCIRSLYVLNDDETSRALNAKYKTDKFKFTVDPAPNIKGLEIKDLRSSLGIPSDNTVYLHFGGLSERKGTLEILRAIKMARHDEFHDKTFVFAGRIYEEIHNEFYKLLKECRQKAQIIVYDEFCEYSSLYNLCYTADVILMPYKITTVSSGVLGYASTFDKKVVGPSKGLIGHLITRYHIGEAIDDVSANGLFKYLSGKHSALHSTEYACVNTVEKFINSVFDTQD